MDMSSFQYDFYLSRFWFYIRITTVLQNNASCLPPMVNTGAAVNLLMPLRVISEYGQDTRKYLGCVYFLKKNTANKRFPVTSNLRYMHGVLNVDEIKN
jgi:hypothetical protein